MGSKWRIKLYIAFTIIVVAIVLYPSSMPTKMPVYRGRTIDQWYSDFAAPENSPEARARAGQVLREMGTNWTPALIERFRDFNDSAIKLKLMSIANRQSWVKFSFTTAAMRRETAFNEFVFWGPGTVAVVPELIKLSRDTNAEVAIVALRGLGIANNYAEMPIIEPFIEGTASTNDWVRLYSVSAFCQSYMNWKSRPDLSKGEKFPEEKMLSVLLAGLSDSFFLVRRRTMDELGKLQLKPDLVVPILGGLVQNTNAIIRFDAARALGKYGPAARAAVPALKTALRDLDKSVRNQAAMSLTKIEMELPSTNSIGSELQTK